MATPRHVSTTPTPVTPEKQLAGFISKCPPEMATLTRGVLKTMRARLPGAVEMIYDKRNALAIGFCPNERASDAINSIAVYRNWINLYFFEGDTLPDPERLLQGSGSMVRFVRIANLSDLNKPAVIELMAEALKRADPPLDPKAKRRLLIRQTTKP